MTPTRFYKYLVREEPVIRFQHKTRSNDLRYRETHVDPAMEPFELLIQREGVAEYYFRGEADASYKAGMPRFVRENDGALRTLFANYETWLEEQKGFLAKGRALTRDELIGLLAVDAKSAEGLFWAYVLPDVAEASDSLKALALRVRAIDHEVGHPIRRLIQSSLEALYPTHPHAASITEEEFLADRIPSEETLAQRHDEYVMINGTLAEESLEAFLKRTGFELVDDQPESSVVSEVRGQIASPGIARGYVRIVRKTADCAAVLDGEILVSPMTNPEFIPAMKRAAAFVTEEGGITSHAAIIARELGKPCVIGTKVATKVFQNGDEVEVDATKGIVRRV